MKQRTLVAAVAAALLIGSSLPALAQADNTNSRTAPRTTTGDQEHFSGWLSDYQTKHEGRISKKAYMDEAGRRWDSSDSGHQGLTSEQINRMYGSSQMDSVTGTTTAPGAMGPRDTKK